MATQNQPPKRGRNDLIECPNCHEQYSPTYNRCPFCKEAARMAARPAAGARRSRTEGERRPRPEGEQRERRPRTEGEQGEQRERRTDGERRPRSGDGSGRRVARTTRGGGYGKKNNLSLILFFAITLALIIAACVVVGKIVGPLLNRGTTDEEDTSPSITETETDKDEVEADVYVPQVEDVVEEPSVIAITLSHADVTLGAGESFTLTANLTPSDADDTVVWTTSSSAATVSLTGLVTNTNTGSSAAAVTVTATVGDVTAECIVRCKTTSTVSASSTSGTGNATVVASSGLNIRSAPSTDGTLIGSLENGSSVTILSSPSSDWYEISYYDGSGTVQTGYASSSYIQAN